MLLLMYNNNLPATHQLSQSATIVSHATVQHKDMTLILFLYGYLCIFHEST